jgi:hypothetical protein
VADGLGRQPASGKAELPMNRPSLIALALSLAACESVVAPPDNHMDLRIVSPAAGATIWDLDPVFLVGEASARSVGVLPDDSLWWTDGGGFLGTGRRLEIRATAGEHHIQLHARYGTAEDSVACLLAVQAGGLGRVIWALPLGYDLNNGQGLSLMPDGRLLAYEPSGVFVVVRPDGSVELRDDVGADFRFASPALGPTGIAYYTVKQSRGDGVLAWAPSGALRWWFNVHDYSSANEELPFGGVALDSAENIYFATEAWDLPVYSVDRNGAFRWRSATRPYLVTRSFGWVAVVQDSLVVAMPSRTDSAVAVSTADGSVRWTAPVGSGWFNGSINGPHRCPVPVVAVGQAGTVYVPSSEGGVTAVAPSGSILWSTSAGGMQFTNPIVGADAVYGATLGGAVRVWIPSGIVDTLGRWDSIPGTATLGRNDVLYVAGRDTLFSFSGDGTRRFATPIDHFGTGCTFSGYSGPVIGSDGTVYLHITGGALIAVRDTVGPATNAPWPTFQGNFQRTGRVATDQ